MKRTKKYDGEEGSLVEADTPAQRIEFSEETGSTGPAKAMSFKEAFASARGAGDKTFEWQGKKYTTELASPKPSKAAEPAPKPPKESETESKPVKAAAKYETPYDRMNRINREEAAARKAAKANEPAPKRSGYTIPKSSEFTGMGGMKFAKGGSVSSASKRADGCAVKGKTKGRFV
jgi:hypothetical protein